VTITATDEFGEHYFTRLHNARNHWWVAGMHAMGRLLLPKDLDGWRVLDAGCGGGASFDWITREVGPQGLVVGCDFAPSALAVAANYQTSTTVLGRASVTDLPFPSDRFQLVVSADVLQHLNRDQAIQALREVNRVLAPNGWFLVRTNSSHGRAHVVTRDDWRLYSTRSLRDELEEAGFVVERLSPANCMPALVALLTRGRAMHESHGADDPHAADAGASAALGIPGRSAGWRDRVGRRALASERAWMKLPHARLPFGHSLVAVARSSRA
jgi:ubiquinone/menaquinone biosynthesis C-methylase UbiE